MKTYFAQQVDEIKINIQNEEFSNSPTILYSFFNLSFESKG